VLSQNTTASGGARRRRFVAAVLLAHRQRRAAAIAEARLQRIEHGCGTGRGSTRCGSSVGAFMRVLQPETQDVEGF
jgi:hypothetical protein